MRIEDLRYDPETGLLTGPTGKEVGHVKMSDSGKQYRRVRLDTGLKYVHVLIWRIVTGSWPEGQVDHEDGNGLNNRWLNLRQVPPAINSQNLKRYSNNTSGVPGVHWRQRESRWVARIRVGKVDVWLGRYHTKPEAVVARKQAELDYGFHPNHGIDRPL